MREGSEEGREAQESLDDLLLLNLEFQRLSGQVSVKPATVVSHRCFTGICEFIGSMCVQQNKHESGSFPESGNKKAIENRTKEKNDP